MNAPLRSGLARLAEAADAVAKVTAIPAVQVEKDFWITEVLRGVAAFGAEIGVYEAVVLGQLLWPDSPQPTLEDCCQLVHRHAGLL